MRDVRDDFVGLFLGARAVAGMLYFNVVQARTFLPPDDNAMLSRRIRRAKPLLIHRLGDEGADVGLHAIRNVQKDAAMRRNGPFTAQQMLQNRIAAVKRLLPLPHLRELRRVAQKHDVPGACGKGECVGERHLSGLVDEEVIELFCELLACEEPSRTAGEEVVVAIEFFV